MSTLPVYIRTGTQAERRNAKRRPVWTGSLHAHGPSWRAIWTDPRGVAPKERKLFPTWEEADAWLITKALAFNAGLPPEPEPADVAPGMTLGDLWRRYDEYLVGRLEEGTIRPQSVLGYRTEWKRRIRPALADVTLTELDRKRIKGFLGELRTKDGKRLAPVSRNKTHAVLCTLLEYAVDDLEILPYNTAKGIKRAPVGKPQRVHVTLPEVVKFAEVISPHYRLAVLLMGLCGLRISEVFGLGPRAFQVRDGWIEVCEQIVDNKPHQPTKTGTSRLTPLPRGRAAEWFTQEILAHTIRFGSDEFVFHNHRNPKQDWYEKRNFYAPWRRAVRKVLGPDRYLNPHALRSAAVSFWLDHDVPLETISVWLGHANYSTTEKYYRDLLTRDHRGVDNLGMTLAPVLDELFPHGLVAR